jgi:hypothetical protein
MMDSVWKMQGVRKMNRKKLIHQVMWTILIMLLLAGCGAPTATPTPVPPTATPVPTLPFEITFEVTFNGNECTVSGPAEVSKGYIYVAIDNKSDQYASPWVDHFLDGKTYQDFLDEIHIAPDVSHRNPDWVEITHYVSKGNGVYEFTLDETGEHAIFIGDYKPWREYPCGTFQVIEEPSE